MLGKSDIVLEKASRDIASRCRGFEDFMRGWFIGGRPIEPEAKYFGTSKRLKAGPVDLLRPTLLIPLEFGLFNQV